MNNTYNSNIYLTTNDLNSIENTIESLTNQIQEKIFNNQQSPLRYIQTGDNLDSKTLYISFPRTLYDDLPDNDTTILTTDNGNTIRYHKYTYSNYDSLIVELVYKNKNYSIYRKDTDENYIRRNIKKYKLPYDFGEVISIANTSIFYEYIHIYENENIIPNYQKNIWEDNDVLSMQKLDNIENGIKNIGFYYYKPNNWISTIEWLKTCTINDNDNNVNMRNISYQDLNRWVTDLNLINFDDLQNMTIWNSNISQINWNEDNNVEWEDY